MEINVQKKQFCIDIDSLATEERLKDTFLDCFREKVREYLCDEMNFTRILTNAVYLSMYRFISHCTDGKAKDLIKENVYKAINEIPYYAVFREQDHWHSESEGNRILTDVVRGCRPLIRERCEHIIAEYPFHELDQAEIGDVIYNCIMDRLFGKSQDTE